MKFIIEKNDNKAKFLLVENKNDIKTLCDWMNPKTQASFNYFKMANDRERTHYPLKNPVGSQVMSLNSMIQMVNNDDDNDFILQNSHYFDDAYQESLEFALSKGDFVRVNKSGGMCPFNEDELSDYKIIEVKNNVEFDELFDVRNIYYIEYSNAWYITINDELSELNELLLTEKYDKFSYCLAMGSSQVREDNYKYILSNYEKKIKSVFIIDDMNNFESYIEIINEMISKGVNKIEILFTSKENIFTETFLKKIIVSNDTDISYKYLKY